MRFQKNYDVIIIGGGHAGTEAALAAARMGVSTLLLTHNIETLGQMSCNPAIGGIGKGHLVKEIDAMGGIMAHAIDCAGIQFRRLNASKGPAVRATRAQADRELYKRAIRHALETQENLTIFQQAVEDIIIENNRATGVLTQLGLKIFARSIVLTAGTFLGGRIHVGDQSHLGGRAGDPPSITLASRLRAMPFRVGRLKTGTPPRLDARSLDYTRMVVQAGDDPCPVFSYLGEIKQHPPQVNCHITHTTPQTHQIIQEHLHRSAMYSGKIEGVGPRYCPSIEDKVVRFADKDQHQIFVEPEGLNTFEIYPNGISTSLPFDAQVAFVQSILGFERAHITRPGYAIEYDYFNPQDLHATLETKIISDLFFAGQINGTTGYEEAAAQGLVAGINAALRAQHQPGWFPRRDQAYIGVMIDDLITHGTQEPYRMFTSRAEYRLSLREDNADQRLTPIARELGLVSDVRWHSFQKKRESVLAETQRLKSTWVQPGNSKGEAVQILLQQPIEREYSLLDLLKRPEISYRHLKTLEMFAPWVDDEAVAEQVEVQVKYAGYIERQSLEIERQERYEGLRIPLHFNYHEVIGLSHEVQQKLVAVKPDTVGMAGRIAGITPAALSLLLVHLRKYASA